LENRPIFASYSFNSGDSLVLFFLFLNRRRSCVRYPFSCWQECYRSAYYRIVPLLWTWTEAVPPPALEEAGKAILENGVKDVAAQSTAVAQGSSVTRGQTGDVGSRAVRAPAALHTTTRLNVCGRKPSISGNWKRNSSANRSLKSSESGKKRRQNAGRRSLNGTSRKH